MMVFGHKHHYVLCFLSLKKLLAVTYGIVQIKAFLSAGDDGDVKRFKEKKPKTTPSQQTYLNGYC